MLGGTLTTLKRSVFVSFCVIGTVPSILLRVRALNFGFAQSLVLLLRSESVHMRERRGNNWHGLSCGRRSEVQVV